MEAPRSFMEGREIATFEPTVLADVDKSYKISCKEAFGPVVIIEKFNNFNRAIEETNDSVYGLQTGIFTRDINKAMKAFEELEVGGVVVLPRQRAAADRRVV